MGLDKLTGSLDTDTDSESRPVSPTRPVQGNRKQRLFFSEESMRSRGLLVL